MATLKFSRIPDFGDLAILLDVDGTIVDIAATPQKVVVPASLRGTLTRLSALTGGALAFVTGRSLYDLDRLFAPLQLPAVAGHGAEFRLPSGTEYEQGKAMALDSSLKHKLAAVAEIGSGIVAEDKGYAVALHYRLAPEKESAVLTAVANICASQPSIELLPGKYVVEIKKAGFSKATGVRDLMKRAPFAGRRPIFIGDDTTDEYVFAIMPEYNGLAFSVGDSVGGVDGHFEGPPAVRDWLANIAGIKADAAP
jgi:trehalose 6-phosphate phosphatase